MRFPAVTVLLLLLTACSNDPAAPGDSGALAARDAHADERDAMASESDGSVSGADASSTTDLDATTPSGSAALEGYWVWKETREDGAVRTEISEEDLEWMVGPTGWEGCPEGISCTEHGIHVVAFASGGRAHYVHRVTTGSDTQHPATFTVEGDLLEYHRTEQFSCAHPPGGSEANAGDFYARFRREADDLWLSVSGFSGLPFESSVPDAAPSRWIVFRPITQADFHGRYDHPYCGAARKGVPACHDLCASDDVLAD
ncbi:MAG: hypothetical protein M3Y87_06500 [Myxococcota bacterium]|nr:hypothetical protein [Myxococcota bacterium]